MASINKVIIVGNLGRDPENRYLPSGEQVTGIAVATTDRWRDKATGEQKEATEWHRISGGNCGSVSEKGIAGLYRGTSQNAEVYGQGRHRPLCDGNHRRHHADAGQPSGRGRGYGRVGKQQTFLPSGVERFWPYAGEVSAGSGRQQGSRAPSLSDMDDDIPF